MPDISISIGSSLPRSLFDRLSYPWRKKFGERSAGLISDKSPGERANVEFIDFDNDLADAADGEELLTELVKLYVDEKGGANPSSPSDEALFDLLDPYVGDDKTLDSSDVAEIKQNLSRDPEAADKLNVFFDRIDLDAGIEWVEFELSQKPGSNLGNPIALTNLKMGVRAKARLCVKIFGREICANITSPWFRFEGDRVQVELITDNLKLRAKAKVKDIDFVIKIRILGKTFKFKIGITSFINRALENDRPVIADFSAIAIKVPGLGLTYTPTAISVPTSDTTTSIALDGAFKT